MAIALLTLVDDFETGIVEGTSFDWDYDTITSIDGNILDALYGASAVRADWKETVEEANAPFFERAAAEDRAAQLDTILG